MSHRRALDSLLYKYIRFRPKFLVLTIKTKVIKRAKHSNLIMMMRENKSTNTISIIISYKQLSTNNVYLVKIHNFFTTSFRLVGNEITQNFITINKYKTPHILKVKYYSTKIFKLKLCIFFLKPKMFSNSKYLMLTGKTINLSISRYYS